MVKKEISFSEKCYLILKKVPKGKITTYKDLAKAMKTKAYRAVGTAMNKNPFGYREVGGTNSFKKKELVPCHRVVNSNGSVGGFATGVKKKIALLRKEGIPIKNNKVVNFEKFLYKFK